MTTASQTIPETPRRAVVSIIGDCEEFTDLLMSTARMLDNLEAGNATMDARDLAPIRHTIRAATQAIEDLHDMALSVAKAQADEAHATRIPGAHDRLVLRLIRDQMRELTAEASKALTTMDMLDAENGPPAG